MTVPTCKAYDPAYAYELAVIIEDGLKRMYRDQEDCFYYLTVMNEQYAMPPMPEGAREGILRGIYKLKAADAKGSKLQAQILGSGAILGEAVKAQQILAEKYGVAADVWSVTSYTELYRDGLAAERHNMLHPGETPKVPYVSEVLGNQPGVFVAASDYMKIMPGGIDRWLPRPMHLLGTDGFGRSESRAALRDFFEVDARFIVFATLTALLKDKKVDAKVVQLAMKDLGIDAGKKNPAVS
jgi:pyruvate dehydrogenase E1 component